jgi:uracil-DNA glycosylase
VIATIHPSALLRLPEGADRHAEMQRFVEDLRKAVRLLELPAQPGTI